MLLDFKEYFALLRDDVGGVVDAIPLRSRGERNDRTQHRLGIRHGQGQKSESSCGLNENGTPNAEAKTHTDAVVAS